MMELSITTRLREISERLSDAAAIAKASVSCAESGSEREALKIAMDVNELLHEAVTLHGAVCLIGRMERRRVELACEVDRTRCHCAQSWHGPDLFER